MQKKILVTLDGSALSEQALPHAVRYARLESAQLLLMRAVEPLAKSNRPGSASVGVIESAERQLKEIVQDYLDVQSARLREQGLQVSTHLKAGNPSQEILKLIEAERVDLIAVSYTHLTLPTN